MVIGLTGLQYIPKTKQQLKLGLMSKPTITWIMSQRVPGEKAPPSVPSVEQMHLQRRVVVLADYTLRLKWFTRTQVWMYSGHTRPSLKACSPHHIQAARPQKSRLDKHCTVCCNKQLASGTVWDVCTVQVPRERQWQRRRGCHISYTCGGPEAPAVQDPTNISGMYIVIETGTSKLPGFNLVCVAIQNEICPNQRPWAWAHCAAGKIPQCLGTISHALQASQTTMCNSCGIVFRTLGPDRKHLVKRLQKRKE